MTVEEIFESIAAHMVDGLMFHSDMVSYFHFLGFYGYKECQDYHYIEESKNHMDLCEYYMDRYDRLIPQKINFSSPIPQKWYQYSKDEVDKSTRKAAIMNGFSKWVEWETDTLKFLEKMYGALLDLDEYASARFIGHYIDDVTEELNGAKRKYLELKSIDFDMTVIIEEQDQMVEEYKKKKKKVYR